MLLWAPVSPRKFIGVAVDPLEHHVLEEADVRAERLVIQGRIHLLGDAAEHGDLPADAFAHLPQPVIDEPAVAGSDASRGQVDARHHVGRGLFDFDVDQDEPVLVIEVDEILDRVDVPQRDRPRGVEPLPVVKGIAVVAQDRRPREASAHVRQRHGQALRQHAGQRLADLVDIGRRQKPQPHVAEPQLRQHGGGIGRLLPGRNLEAPRRSRKPESRSKLGRSRPISSSTAIGLSCGNAVSGSASGRKAWVIIDLSMKVLLRLGSVDLLGQGLWRAVRRGGSARRFSNCDRNSLFQHEGTKKTGF